MINKKKVLGIITARSGSKGLKNKNLKKINGFPLIYWPIKAFQKSKYLDDFCLSTDSIKIAKIANKYECKTPFLRPKKISHDNSSSISVLKHCINFFKKKNNVFDYVVLLEPTSPMTTAKDIDDALKILDKKRDIADSIVGVAENLNFHPEFNVNLKSNKLIKVKKKLKHIRRQNLNKLYIFDGSLYISKTNILLKKETFYHKKTLGHIMPKSKSFELDDIVDYICINALMKNKKLK